MKTACAALAALLLCVYPATVSAAGWTPDLSISRAFVENSDLVVIYTSDGGQYSTGCAANAWIYDASTDARRDRGYSTILSALLAGKKVRFWFADDCAAWGYHRATAVMIVK